MYAVLYVSRYGNLVKESCQLKGVDEVYIKVFKDLEAAKNFAQKVYKDRAELVIVVPVLFVRGIEIEGELIEC